jgi:hypothetical protein
MKSILLQEKYPLFTLEVEKQETRLASVDEILAYLKNCIDENDIAQYIAIFDHYRHTDRLEAGQIGEGILDAKNIIFCFGITLPNPQSMAVRPRSIGVVELEESYIITFMEAPMPLANVAMETWAKAIKNRQVE